MPTLNGNSTASQACLERQILDHVKQALRVTLNWEAPVVSMPRKLSSLQFTIKSFQRHFDRVISIEESGGYMSEVAESKPHLENRVKNLQSDHSRFRTRLNQLKSELSDIHEWDEAGFEQACEELRRLLDDIDRHDASEVDLLQESLMTDEGGGG